MNASPRLKRVLKYQFFAMFLNAILMTWTSLWLVDVLLPQPAQGEGLSALALRWLVVFALMVVTTRWLNNLSLMLINMLVYSGDLEAAATEALEASSPRRAPTTTTEPVDFFIIGKPEQPVAHYQGVEIFEWLDVQDEAGAKHRLHFDGTVDMARGLPQNITPGTLLLPPGIIYTISTQ